MAEEIHTDKQGNEVSLEELLKGKSDSQQIALKFFAGEPVKKACFKKTYLTAEGYSDLVSENREHGDYKQRALQKLGIDEEQVQEIDPVMFEGYRYEHERLMPYLQVVEGKFVSSMYEITWLFFGDEQVYAYHCAFDTTDQTASENTLEYFYRDITAFATGSDNVEKKIWVAEGSGCSKTRESQKKMVSSELFRIVVPGDAFSTALTNEDEFAGSIAAMKQKLREKKTQ